MLLAPSLADKKSSVLNNALAYLILSEVAGKPSYEDLMGRVLYNSGHHTCNNVYQLQ